MNGSIIQVYDMNACIIQVYDMNGCIIQVYDMNSCLIQVYDMNGCCELTWLTCTYPQAVPTLHGLHLSAPL